MERSPLPASTLGMTTTNDIAPRLEQAGASIARWGVVLALGWIGLTKFTAGEAEGIAGLVEHSPFVAWMYDVWSRQATSNVIGVAELLAATLIAGRRWWATGAALGALLAIATFLVTLSFIATTPGSIDLSHGIPLPGGAAQFLLKDVALLGGSVWALGDALRAVRVRRMELVPALVSTPTRKLP